VALDNMMDGVDSRKNLLNANLITATLTEIASCDNGFADWLEQAHRVRAQNLERQAALIEAARQARKEEEIAAEQRAAEIAEAAAAPSIPTVTSASASAGSSSSPTAASAGADAGASAESKLPGPPPVTSRPDPGVFVAGMNQEQLVWWIRTLDPLARPRFPSRKSSHDGSGHDGEDGIDGDDILGSFGGGVDSSASLTFGFADMKLQQNPLSESI